MQRLILQLQETHSYDQLKCCWWLFDNQTLLNQGFFTSPEDIAKFDFSSFTGEVVVFVPAQRVHMRRLALSKTQYRYRNKVVPHLMEPHLGQNIEMIHFTTSLASKESAWCYATEENVMAIWLEWVNHIVSRQVYLLALPSVLKPFPEDSLFDVLGQTFQYTEQQWCWLPKNMAKQQAIKLLTIEEINHILEQSKDWRRDNLLQGKFDVNHQQAVKHYSWVGVICLVVLAFSVHSINVFLETQSLSRQAVNVENIAKQAFLELVPEEEKVIHLERQVSARLKSNEKAEPEMMTAYEVLAMLDSVREQTNETLGLQGITWQPKEYRFEWLTSPISNFERIQQAFEREGLSVELEQTIKQDETYLGVFRSTQESTTRKQ